MRSEGRPGGHLLGVSPGPGLNGTARVPGSKSIAQRVLLAAALARGTTRFQELPPGEDVVAAAGMASRLAGLGREGVSSEPVELFAAESGTLARLTLATVGLGAAGRGPFRLAVGGSLVRRRSAPLIEALRAAGAAVEAEEDGWPLLVTPVAAAPERLWLIDPVSSQEASGLCLALAALGGERTLEIAGPVPSAPYLRMTLEVLADFGVQCSAEGLDTERSHVVVRGPLLAPGGPVGIETDASLAAVVLAAGVASGGRVEVEGVPDPSRQGDAKVHELLAGLGFDAGRADGVLFAGPRPGAPGAADPTALRRGPDVLLDLGDVPDLAPVLVALAAASRPGRATFTGLETLDRKESPRLRGLVRGLDALGIEVNADSSRLTLVRPDRLGTDAIVLDCEEDHRMAFAWSLLGLARAGVTLRGANCVGKSWPGYFDELERLGARLTR